MPDVVDWRAIPTPLFDALFAEGFRRAGLDDAARSEALSYYYACMAAPPDSKAKLDWVITVEDALVTDADVDAVVERFMSASGTIRPAPFGATFSGLGVGGPPSRSRKRAKMIFPSLAASRAVEAWAQSDELASLKAKAAGAYAERAALAAERGCRYHETYVEAS